MALIVETGEAREVHDLCCLVGFGADAIAPYQVFNALRRMRQQGKLDEAMDDKEVYLAYVSAAARGISKVMAKMGISTLHSYKGAQIFEAVGLHRSVIDKVHRSSTPKHKQLQSVRTFHGFCIVLQCFSGTASRLSGATFEILAQEGINRHRYAYALRECDNRIVVSPGFYQWRDGGEQHMNDPATIANMQV